MDQSDKQATNRRESIGLAFFWLVVLAYGFFIPSILSWNTESHLYPAFALVDHHTIRIDAYQQGLGDKSFHNGHYYTDKAPGLSFLAVPVYGAMRLAFPHAGISGFKLYKHIKNYYYIPQDVTYVRYAITYLLVALPSAVLAILMWLFLMRLTGDAGWSMALAAVYALGTIAYVYSIWFFSHQICAILLFGAFLLIFYRIRGKEPDRRLLLSALGAGFLAGFSIISEYPTVIIAAILGIYMLVVARDRLRTLIAFVLGMAPPAALNIGYNLVAFGKPLAMGYLYVHSKAYHVHVHTGFLGISNPFSYAIKAPSLNSLYEITFGTYRGLFLVNPVLLLFFAGVFFMWKRRDVRAEMWLCVAIVLVYFLLDASRGADTNGWSGGSSVASRHLTPMIPFMIVPIAFGLRDRSFRALFVVWGAVSMAIMFMTVSSTYLFPYTDRNPIFNEVLPNFFHGKIIPNWVYVWRSSIGITGFATLLPFFAIALLLIGWIVRILMAGVRPAPATQTVTELETTLTR
ncbi:MAG: hypothetical protein ACRDFX_06060 [Chloroflexota bacterium]